MQNVRRAENTENRHRGSIIENIENRESEITDVVWMIKTENREQTIDNREYTIDNGDQRTDNREWRWRVDIRQQIIKNNK